MASNREAEPHHIADSCTLLDPWDQPLPLNLRVSGTRPVVNEISSSSTSKSR